VASGALSADAASFALSSMASALRRRPTKKISA
jgi:hypothetical protein